MTDIDLQEVMKSTDPAIIPVLCNVINRMIAQLEGMQKQRDAANERADRADALAKRLARDRALADHNMMKEDRDRLFHQNVSIKNKFDAMFRRAAQADADRERTYQENRILTMLWCGLRDKVKLLPKSDMTIGSWHDLQDFVKNLSHTDGRLPITVLGGSEQPEPNRAADVRTGDSRQDGGANMDRVGQ